MIEKIKELIVKYREIIVYIIVGGICTVVSWGCKFLWNQFVFGGPLHPTAFQTSVLSVVTWVSGVAVAYPLNRKFVFLSHGPWVPECIKFCGSRVSTFFLDLLLTEVLGPLFGINVFVVTLISAVLVTIANYVFSKVFVFKDKKETKTEE